MGSRIFPTLPLADFTAIFLLSIGRSTVARDLFASTVRTVNRDRYHSALRLSKNLPLFYHCIPFFTTTGGAYMLLLTDTARNTDDIDIFWLEEEEGLQRALRPLQEGVIAVAQANQIDPTWLNYMTQLLIYDLIIVPEGIYGKRMVHFIFMLRLIHPRTQDIRWARERHRRL